MPSDTRPLRLLLFAALAVLVAALLWLLFGALNGALALWRELEQLHWSLRALVLALVLAVVGAGALIGWRLLRPTPRRARPRAAPTRASVEERLAALQALDAAAPTLEQELRELDRRRAEGECYVALFGEISAGKSSLVRALAPQAEAQVDVLGGTTTRVAHQRGSLPDGRALVLADVPGSQEVGGREREQLARDEALRAHAVVYVADADLTRQQDAELRWLHGFGKPLLLALSKSDRYRPDEEAALLAALRRRYGELAEAVVAVRGGGEETLERIGPDGRRETLRRPRAVEVESLRRALSQLTRAGVESLEAAREQAVLGGVAQALDGAEAQARVGRAERVVDKYTRRAVIGALAAVAPGSDLVIQGVLAAGLVRELAALYAVPVKDVDLDAFLARASLSVRTATTVVLAIAGNALKAFPGLGTLGGGMLHAVAYGLVFDSLGRAVAATLAEQQRFDAEHAVQGLQQRLGEAARERLRQVAQVVWEEQGAKRDADGR